MLVASRVQVAGEVEELLASHHLLTGARREPASLPENQQVITASHVGRQSTFLIRSDDPIYDPRWTVGPVSMEDLVLAYMKPAGDAERDGSPGRGDGQHGDGQHRGQHDGQHRGDTGRGREAERDARPRLGIRR